MVGVSLFTFLNTLSTPLSLVVVVLVWDLRWIGMTKERLRQDILKRWNPIQHDPGTDSSTTVHSLNTLGDCHSMKQEFIPYIDLIPILRDGSAHLLPSKPSSRQNQDGARLFFSVFFSLDFFLSLLLLFILFSWNLSPSSIYLSDSHSNPTRSLSWRLEIEKKPLRTVLTGHSHYCVYTIFLLSKRVNFPSLIVRVLVEKRAHGIQLIRYWVNLRASRPLYDSFNYNN